MFVDEIMPPMLVALSGGPLRPLLELIGDWKATAEVWADESLREELMERVDSPLFDVSL
jgi:hypothetical protein